MPGKEMIKDEIVEYVDSNIIPLYQTFDKAHSEEHVRRVIQNSFEIAAEYQVNIEMVYVIAAYHDVGIQYGRENHEKTSAEFLTADSELKRWFSEEEVAVMAEAVCDHRASKTGEPRSLYGKIVSEADRDIDYITVLTRTIQFGMKKFPQLTQEEHFERVYEHLQEKYGRSGYIKLWLSTGKNSRNLEEIRKTLESKETVRKDYDRICRQI